MAAHPPAGIRRKRGTEDITTPDFELAPDAIPGIAQVIVDIWQQTKPNLDKILQRETTGAKKGMATQDAINQATAAMNGALPYYNFVRAVIISEEEHDNGYMMETENDVVFVLPNKGRINPAGTNLLNSAKLLMACTPNGI
jgi:hypothetical protein